MGQGGSPRRPRAGPRRSRPAAWPRPGTPDDVKAMKETARLKLWTIFQAEVTQADCPLPPEVRKNMLALCNFVDKHTVRLLANPEPGFDVLININRQIAAGLLAEAPAQGGPTVQDPGPAGPQGTPPPGRSPSSGGRAGRDCRLARFQPRRFRSGPRLARTR